MQPVALYRVESICHGPRASEHLKPGASFKAVELSFKLPDDEVHSLLSSLIEAQRFSADKLHVELPVDKSKLD